MTCTPANAPMLIQVSDLIYPPDTYERRFLTGWWTRGVIPQDQFVSSNWAGLIIPKRILFEENNITIEFPGRHWDEGGCQRSMPKVTITIQYLCKGGRLYLHSQVQYGKIQTDQVYAGHNGALKFSRVPLEKVDEPCSLERVADIPIEEPDVLNIRHLADWLVTMLSVPDMTANEPTTYWLSLFADYTEVDLEWAPCQGCLFPTQNWSVPAVLSSDNMLQLEARLAVQDIKALGDLIILGSVPEAFNVPLCPRNTYLEVSIPSLASVVHMRTFFNCDTSQYFTDEYTTIPVENTDIANCFQFPSGPTWPARDDPRWVPECLDVKTEVCNLDEHIEFRDTRYYGDSTPGSSYTGVNFDLCSGTLFVPAKYKSMRNGYVLTISKFKRTRQQGLYCRKVSQYSGPDLQIVQCGTTELITQEILKVKEFPQATGIDAYLQSMRAANRNFNCGSSFNDPDGNAPPPQPQIPPDDNPQGPNQEGNCFLEGELIYVLNLRTIVGDFGYEAKIPVRAKLPQGRKDLGFISGSLSGTSISISTQFGGSFTANLDGLFSVYNAFGRTISSILPVSFGLRNVRVLCP